MKGIEQLYVIKKCKKPPRTVGLLLPGWYWGLRSPFQNDHIIIEPVRKGKKDKKFTFSFMHTWQWWKPESKWTKTSSWSAKREPSLTEWRAGSFHCKQPRGIKRRLLNHFIFFHAFTYFSFHGCFTQRVHADSLLRQQTQWSRSVRETTPCILSSSRVCHQHVILKAKALGEISVNTKQVHVAYRIENYMVKENRRLFELECHEEFFCGRMVSLNHCQAHSLAVLEEGGRTDGLDHRTPPEQVFTWICTTDLFDIPVN